MRIVKNESGTSVKKGSNKKMAKILDGIRIIDFTQGHMGSYGTMLLADFGAEVIKIEDPSTGGDPLRRTAPKNEKGSAYHAYLNRGKRSIALDRHSEEGKAILLKLISTADVVCDCFAPEELERCGLGYEDVKESNPGIIYASHTGFGTYGPLSVSTGCDLTSEAHSGLMEVTGYPDSCPTAHGSRMADQFGGVYFAAGIVSALISRAETGKGQKLEVASADCMLSALEDTIAAAAIKGKTFHREGNGSRAIAPYDVFEVKDGVVATAISTNSQWEKFCEAMELTELLEDERYATNESRGEYYYADENNPDCLRDKIASKFAGMTKKECKEALDPYNLPSGPEMTVEDAYSDEQMQVRRMIIEVDDKALGRIKMMGVPLKISGVDDTDIKSAPLLGEDTEYYFRELGIEVE